MSFSVHIVVVSLAVMSYCKPPAVSDSVTEIVSRRFVLPVCLVLLQCFICALESVSIRWIVVDFCRPCFKRCISQVTGREDHLRNDL